MSKAATAGGIQAVRLLVPAAKATAAPPVGPALGARGLKSIDFASLPTSCLAYQKLIAAMQVKEFNARTAHMVPGTPTPVKMAVDTSNRSFTFTMKSPPTSWLLMQAAGISKGSGTPPAGKALIQLGNAPNPATPADVNIPTTAFKELGTVSLKHVYEIAKIKKKDEHLKHVGLEELARSILGTSRNIGIRVIP